MKILNVFIFLDQEQEGIIAIVQKGDVTLKLKRELDELRCIYTFDVVDMNLIGEKLKENIEKDKICIYKK